MLQVSSKGLRVSGNLVTNFGRQLLAVLSFASLGIVACSSSGGAATDESRTGVTSCGTSSGEAVHCQAGQHCTDEVLNICDTGCLTDNNCPASQKCNTSTGKCGATTPPSGTTPAPTGTVLPAGPRTGVTDCGKFGSEPIHCQAGQHCTDEVLNKCSEGCLTDNNCPVDQKCNTSTGKCGTGGGTTPPKDTCERNTFWDQSSCTGHKGKAKAYQCPSVSIEPTDPNCEHSDGLTTVWCCPS